MDPLPQPKPDNSNGEPSRQRGPISGKAAAPASDNLTAIVHQLQSLLDGATKQLQQARTSAEQPQTQGAGKQQGMLGNLEAAELALDRMARVIQLAMSPAAAGLLERFTEPCPLIEALLHAIEVHAPLAIDKRININIDCSPRLVLTPAGPLYTVLASALRNAVEAMNEGGEVEIIAELVTPSRGDPEVHIDILDSGPGPNLDASEHAFDLGFTTKETGIGVGLALSQEIIEELGGWMALRQRAVKSTVNGKGGAHLMIRYPAMI